MTMKKIMLVMSVLLLTAYASTTPTREIQSGYAIYDVQPGDNVSHKQIIDAVVTAVKKNGGKAKIINNIPPSPLPETPGRFEVVNPFEGTRMEALAGQSLGIPKCKDSLVDIHTQKTGMQKYGERTTFFVCVLPYEGGYHIDIYSQFTKDSGAFSVETLGADLARALIGDSSKFIPRTMGEIVAAVRATGSTVILVEGYP